MVQHLQLSPYPLELVNSELSKVTLYFMFHSQYFHISDVELTDCFEKEGFLGILNIISTSEMARSRYKMPIAHRAVLMLSRHHLFPTMSIRQYLT